MTRNGKVPALAILAVLTAATGVGALCAGRYVVSVRDVFRVIVSRWVPMEPTWGPTVEKVVLLIRLPRLAAALLVGSCLAVSGATYQSIFKNQLTAPELLGVFQGSCVGAAAAILLGARSFFVQASALCGGILSVVVATLITRFFRSDSSAILVLSGVIVSGVMRSVLGMLKYAMDTETQLPSITYWELGSLSDMTFQKLLPVLPGMAVAMAVLFAMRWQFNLLSLGDGEARSLGVNVAAVRGVTVACATMLTSCAVCLSGTIAWVGLVIPYFGRLVAGPDSVRLTPIAALMGTLFLVVVDTAARSLAGVEIPLSILTGLVGAPIFITMLYRQRRSVR